jgi:hypothetical protein
MVFAHALGSLSNASFFCDLSFFAMLLSQCSFCNASFTGVAVAILLLQFPLLFEQLWAGRT